MEYDLRKCPVCGGSHPGLKFKKLPKAWGDANVVAVCPKDKIPVPARLVIEPVEVSTVPPAAAPG